MLCDHFTSDHKTIRPLIPFEVNKHVDVTVGLDSLSTRTPKPIIFSPAAGFHLNRPCFLASLIRYK